ncbi:MAG: cytochrome c3 family protein [Myxococcota bacterium]
MTRRLVGVVLVLCTSAARADLFSPGDLAKPHAHLEGLSQCTKCHPSGGQLSQASCLSCHDEVQARVAKGAGLHGKLQGEKRNCEACHHDHQGRDASLVDWGGGGKAGFEHKRTGWALKGGHAKLECKDCHEKRRIVWPVALKLLEVRPHTMLGLPTNCEACHFDEHRGQVQEDCAYCHDEKAWKPAPGFNHNETDYKLVGKHAKVKCKECHPTVKDEEKHGFPGPVAETFLRFADVPHQSCLDCHKDVHEGRFGLRCQSCHTPVSWHTIKSTSQEREFHEKTRFPLKGAHVDVECQACHGPWPGQSAKFKNLAFEACTDCHADAHLGQLGVKGKPPDCTTCHTVDGFSPAKYGLPEHAKTKYPLEGAHAVVPCDACHQQTQALAKNIPRAVQLDLKRKKRPERFSLAAFRFTKDTKACDSCHEDVHKGQFSKFSGGCTGCHEVASFAKVTFDHTKNSRYPLEGAHAKVGCSKCHFAPKPGLAVVYKPLETVCTACHVDEHAGQFATAANAPTDCERCHTVKGFKGGELLFAHRPPFTDFLLDGEHAKVKCAACHPKVKVARALETARYKPLPRTCEGCHADFHKGSFAGFEP